MANTIAATCLPLFPSLELAWRDVDSSFERFCLTAGIRAVEQMLREDGQQLTGEQKLTSGLPKPITAPCGSLTQLAARLGTSAGTQLRFFQCTRWRSRAATWVSLCLSATPLRYSA